MREIRRDLLTYGDHDDEHALEVIDDLARRVPLIGAMTTRNFTEIRVLLIEGRKLVPDDDIKRRVVDRGLAKHAPFHKHRNSVADALLIELYAGEIDEAGEFAFVTSNSEDFSAVGVDRREPHADIAAAFDPANSNYRLGAAGLERVLREHFGDELEELLEETDIREEPRRLDEIQAVEKELFDRIWYHRSVLADYRFKRDGDTAELTRNREIAGPGRARVEATYPEPGQLGPYTDFELGMLNGKMSALRWVLGSEWDFLDT
ncbi:hypothetical protein [Glaciibacter superstes]|uniref:hypothetical protein n=1 Tax=Glaciibacter superstes TaxID=501023 RepID=UPI0003B58647|nr:hypothetical protein [Glaciibacter superstes]